MAVIVDLSHPLEHGQLNFPNDPKLGVIVHGMLAGNPPGTTSPRSACRPTRGRTSTCRFIFSTTARPWTRWLWTDFSARRRWWTFCPGTSLAPKTPITSEMLRKHEAKFQSGAKVVCRTGWDRMFNRPEFFTDFPSFTVEAAQWIAARRIGLLGMDMPTPSTEWKEVHWALLGKGTEIVIVEGLANLDRVPERFTLAAFPLNITGRDGSPVRAVAFPTTERPKDHFGVS